MGIRNMIAEGYRPTFADFDLYNCPLCDNVTPAIWCDECDQNHCEGCYNAYGCDGCE